MVRETSKYLDRSSRTSSASRDSDSVVNPTRSANRTLTSRRSVAAAMGLGAATAGRDSGAPRDAPHSPQKSNWGSLAAPQEGHSFASAPPHLPQNFRPGAFSVPQ